jgi:omega-6 fatty acid desaturase (delta-12 desaturase)
MDGGEAEVARTSLWWREVVAPYEQSNDARAAFQLMTTWAALIGVFWLAHSALALSPWIALALAVPAAGLFVRTFIVMHDCGHGSFFGSRKLNSLVGWIAGVITLTPFGQWRRDHARHHASSGDLNRRGHGDVKTLTAREFAALSRTAQWGYRLLRHPVVLFGFGPFHLIFTQRICPRGTPLLSPERRSVWSTNCGIVCLLAGVAWLSGWRVLLLVYLPAIYLAAAVGIWLFYVQHQFEDTFWNESRGWDLHEAALHGSSHYDLPLPLRWFTANIGIHHVHHLHSRIPYYRLPRVLRDHPELREIGRLTLLESFRCVRLVLWDEAQRRLVSFREARASNR